MNIYEKLNYVELVARESVQNSVSPWLVKR